MKRTNLKLYTASNIIIYCSTMENQSCYGALQHSSEVSAHDGPQSLSENLSTELLWGSDAPLEAVCDCWKSQQKEYLLSFNQVSSFS